MTRVKNWTKNWKIDWFWMMAVATTVTTLQFMGCNARETNWEREWERERERWRERDGERERERESESDALNPVLSTLDDLQKSKFIFGLSHSGWRPFRRSLLDEPRLRLKSFLFRSNDFQMFWSKFWPFVRFFDIILPYEVTPQILDDLFRRHTASKSSSVGLF